jgi:hypothetical protein
MELLRRLPRNEHDVNGLVVPSVGLELGLEL